MSSKIGSITTLIAIVAFGIFYFIEINRVPNRSSSISSDFSFFPNILVFSLLFLCAISLFQTFKKKDKTISLNFKLISFTVCLLVAYILSWYYIGLFYLNTLIFLFVIFSIYGKKDNLKKSIIINIFVSVITTSFVYALLTFMAVQV